jgi:hypothetical protein
VAAHGALAHRATAGALAGPCLGGRDLHHDEMDGSVVPEGAAQHGASQPAVGERPYDDHAVGPLQRAPDGDPVAGVHQRAPQHVGEEAESRRPGLAQRVAVERARLGGDEGGLAGAGQAGDDDDGCRLGGEKHPADDRRGR